MKRAALLSLLVVSLAANAAVAFRALRHGPAGMDGGMPAEPPLFQHLKLSEAQRSAILARRAGLLERRAAASTRLGELRGELAAALAQGEAGRARIDGVLAELERAQREYQRSVVEHLLGVREVLTPEQRPVFERLLAERLRSGWMMQPDRMGPGAGSGGSR
ncbi:MAG TPA: periplasmic heavy metal sensor [Anaeromyxobacteraceae bacterium]|nr:periplasmic heavy metal sensor [Anaeromyxobacteraceae bacterium]